MARRDAFLATGLLAPTIIVNNGEVNASAYPRGIVVNSVPPRAGRGVTYHELTHEFFADPLHPAVPVQFQELRADWGAGYMMARTGTARAELRAYLRLVGGDAGDPSHGTPAARVRATLAGYRAGLR